MTELSAEPGFRQRAAALLRAAANDLKRNDEGAEADLGLQPGTFLDYTSGRIPVTWDLIRRCAEVWPLSERDLLPLHDDCPDGVRICRAKESLASARVIERAGLPYYEYRDTAMSRLASYRPEWIRMLAVVDDEDPHNPAVQWNNGHLSYQFTYFIGPVNYYYCWAGERRCVPMRTGDSVWGLPFAVHSFAARTDAEPALILALTYGGGLAGDPQRELSILGTETAQSFALPPGRQPTAQAALLRSFLDGRVVTATELGERARMSPAHIEGFLAGTTEPSMQDLSALAAALGVELRDLLVNGSNTVHGVVIQPARTARRWAVPSEDRPSYRITQLAGDRLHPHTTALELEVLGDEAGDGAPLTTYQHQYLYVLGPSPVRLEWDHGGRRHAETLEPNDSAYAAPYVPIALAMEEGGRPRALLLRISGAVTTDVRFALAAMADGGISRYVAEDGLWYGRRSDRC
jgi:transcriptional regulator with XRE-family HTH domain